jgi:hypothetical protein
VSIFNTVIVYQFIKRLVQPFTEWKAFKLGVIDHDGNFLIPKDKRTPDQKASIGYFDIVVANLKKLLARLPGGSSRIATFAAALMLLREDIGPDDSEETIMARLKDAIDDVCTNEEINSLFESVMNEDGVAANNIGSGAIAAPEKPWRSKFAGQMIFRVDSKRFMECRSGKNRYHRWDKYVGEDDVGKDIREYGVANPEDNIIVQDEQSSCMMYLRRKKN